MCWLPKLKQVFGMDDRTSAIYIFCVFFALLFLSRLISHALRTCFLLETVQSELVTFAIVVIIDFILMHVMMRFGHGRGVFETLNLVFLKAFPFVLFYIVGVFAIHDFIRWIKWFFAFTGM